MTCSLILMRHSYADNPPGCRDFDRPLTGDGRRLATDTGQKLNTLDVRPDVIVASAAARTMATAECVAAQFDPAVPVVSSEELYQAGPSDYPSVLRAAAPDPVATLMVIGHNPAVGSLICGLAGIQHSVPPATLGVFDIEASAWDRLDLLQRSESRRRLLIVNATVQAAAENDGRVD